MAGLHQLRQALVDGPEVAVQCGGRAGVAGVEDDQVVGGQGGVALLVNVVGHGHCVGAGVRWERKAESKWYSKELRVCWK